MEVVTMLLVETVVAVVPEKEEELQETMPLLEVQTKVEAVAVEVATIVEILPITMVLLVDLESLSLDT